MTDTTTSEQPARRGLDVDVEPVAGAHAPGASNTAAGSIVPPASRYAADIDLAIVNDVHVLAVGRVPARSRVLDLGAADGSVAAVLKRMGCHVTAVEIDPVAAASARTVCDDVVVADLNELGFLARFGRGRFDVVLMLDVLEHLLDPAAVLARAGTVLADGGWGVISLPNIAHVSVRLALLKGNFRYTDVGLLDRTHLRFFDREGVDELLRASGWGMFELVRSMRPWGTTEIHFPDADPELVRQIESDPEGLTYQFLISAAPRTSSALSHPPLLPAAAAQAAYLEQGSELGRLRDAFAATAAERDRLEVRLAATTADGELVRSELAHLQAKGDELARLLATAAADRDAARADLESARADLESARADLERGGADRDAARADLQTARADGEAAVAARDDARAQAERLTVDLDTAQSHLSAARDEVRALGVELGLPAEMVYRHPFPGPGMGVRVLGEVKPAYVDLLQRADAIFMEELRSSGWYDKVSQAFAVFLPVRSVGVMGDGRTYEFVVALRAVVTSDFMTAHWAELPYDLLGRVSNRIINEVRGINRVVYDISGKPPATIEWE